MKKNFFIRLFVFLAVFSFSTARAAQYDFFGGFIPQGSPVIDGKITPGEWDENGHITLYKFFGEDAKIEIHVMWDADYLYMAADVEDFELWVDDYDPKAQWISTWDDDAIKWEIDPDYSRHELLQPDDRVFAINADGTATRFDKGNGIGGTDGIWIEDGSTDIRSAARIEGTPNDYTFHTLTSESQKDRGFTVEVAISWKKIMGSDTATAPADGYSLGMNFTNIEDDTGGSLNPEYGRDWKRVFDELTRFMGEEDHPENWAEFVISAKSDRTSPATMSDLAASNIRAFAADITFTATGDNGSSGYAKSYDIRYSGSAITADNWDNAQVYKNSFRPQKAGKKESLRITGLSPRTSYHIGIRALDEQGNASGIGVVTFTTAAPDSETDKGFLTADAGGRYFTWENGEPFIVIGDNQGMSWPHIRSFYDGPMWNDDLGRYENFMEWDTEGIEDGRSYLKMLSEHGVNTIRIMAENLEPENPVYLFDDVSLGPDKISFNQDTLNFLETFLDECAKVSINVIIVPFDTFYYTPETQWQWWNTDTVPFNEKVPFSIAMGGPMYTTDKFFEAENRPYIKAILKKLVDTVGDRKNLLAWDILNEFDSDEPGIGWNRATFENREKFVNDIADYLRFIDPNHMVFLSSVRWDPKFLAHLPTRPDASVTGNDAALVLNNSRFDFNSTHMYYHDIRDPNYNDRNNPYTIYEAEANDLDNTIAPAARVKQGLQFYYAYSLTPKPYLCTEYGPIEFYTTEYDPYFTEQDDEQIFHNMSWAYLASGEAGSGLRWPGKVLEDRKLNPQMRDYQLAMRHFLDSGNLDFTGFQPKQIGQYMKIGNTNRPVIKTGISDGKQGIIFLVNDERKQVNGSISGANLSIPELWPGGTFNVEFWDSYDETKTAPVKTVSVTADASGKAVVSLPDFSKTLAMQFYCTECNEPEGPDTGYMVTDDLWIRSVIHTEDKGPIEGVWHLGGQDTTARGDIVIWGYFYANPDQVSWGSPDNPDLFVKIWIDAYGPVYVDYFHVSVPNITVYTDLPYDGVPDEEGTATLTNRFVEHFYINGVSDSKVQIEDGIAAAGYNPAGNPTGSALINSLRIGSMINTADKGSIPGVWRQGGQNSTARGDQVVWGYFYADPNTVSWGSRENPDLFVKIWFDVGGAVFVDFFHVSVPDIEVYSELPNNGSYDNRGTTILPDRFIEHRYSR